jgi:hypothetical protein
MIGQIKKKIKGHIILLLLMLFCEQEGKNNL